MQCPLCHQEMQVLKEDKTYSFKQKVAKPYTRTLQVCSADDTWITMDTPEQQSITQPDVATISA